MSGKVSALNGRLIDNLEKTLFGKVVLVVAGTLVLAIASQISVPMVPVPITMQTFAVTMIGALYGWRLGGLTVLAWLAEAMVGFPVLAEFKSGIAPFMGPTAGYLVAFPLMAIFVGFLTEKGISANRLFAGFSLHLAANLLCLLLGWMWLAQVIGAEKAWIAGVVPFLIGAVLKSALAATLLKATIGRVKTS
ncbi:biotin transporter BioY [Rhizobium sp. CG4]|jgi:biotin transport system substrate-specific component|uniref:biotin transporter BioY n=1 Tax=Rhizobium/Agrobacterium group TaxID=227290 RepID=UPI0017816803|nr:MULTISPECIES: biotin transporter BioY [Rhizobium/Agrobacterium group]MBD9386228.1 biotin transporter BioY [Agrobacterium sp. AGB01]MCM2455693.1 biotin transporter BioY [Rhizobium sp. CG4]